jgi:adenine-specific DNA glycosylase
MSKIGCFGSVLYHDATQRQCSVCPFVDDCAAEVNKNKAALDKWYNDLTAESKVPAKDRRAKRAMLGTVTVVETKDSPRSIVNVSQQNVTATGKPLAKKPNEFVNRWKAKGLDFEAQKQGINAFTMSGNKFAAVAMALFLEKGEVTKRDLVLRFEEELKWGSGTAFSHANIVFDAFEYLGVIAVAGSVAYLVR